MNRALIWLQWLFGPTPKLEIPLPMEITDKHTLAEAEQDILPGGSPMPIRRFAIIHFTAGWSAKSSVEFWKTPAAKGAGAHVIIDRNGAMTQCRPFDRTAGHAGASKWHDSRKTYEGLNSCSIGIELANCGDLSRIDYPIAGMGTLAGRPIPRMSARHKNGGPIKQWETYTESQMLTLIALCQSLKARYNLDDIVGHDDIAPNRKSDPGPAFDMARLRRECGLPEAIS